MKKFLCYDTNDASSGKINVSANGVLKPNATVPSSSGEPYKSLVTDRDGGVKWEDRLAYEDKIPVNPPVNIVWDGNTEGLVASSQNNFYKVSDDIFTVDEFSQMIVTEKNGTEHNVNEYPDNVIVTNGIISYVDAGPLIATVANAGPNPVGFPDTYPEPGVYFPANGSYTALKWFYSTVIKKLDEKFVTVPSSVTSELTNLHSNLNSRLNSYNPTGTGSLSLNRKANTAIGKNSIAVGKDCIATGECSHAEGGYSTASGNYSHAEGIRSTASGSYSHAEGGSSTASGEYSHAEGYLTQATDSYSHAEGYGTITGGVSQHVQGKYNIKDANGKYAHIVGNGSINNASNAHTLDWVGNAWYAGTVEGTAIIVKSSTSGSSKRFKITVDDSGTISATEV